MTIYEIDARIQEILMRTDEETGELPEDAVAELITLGETREMKVENAACLIVNLTAEAKAIREQEVTLAQRRHSLENRAERIKRYIEFATDGEPFTSSRVTVKYTKSQAVEVTDKAAFFAFADEKFIRRKDPEANNDAIKKAIKAGEYVPGAELVEHVNMQIK